MKRWLFFCLFIWAPLIVHPQWVIDELVTDNKGSAISQQVIIAKNRLKTKSSNEQVIYDLNRQSITCIDTLEKVFATDSPAVYNRSMISWLKSEMENALKAVPADRKAEFASYYLRNIASWESNDSVFPDTISIKVVKTGKTEKILGYNTRKYELWINTVLRFEYWICPVINVSASIDIEGFYTMLETMNGRNNLSAYEKNADFRALMKSGYPMQTIDNNDDVITVTRVQQIAKLKNLADFSIPKSYRKITFEEYFTLHRTE